MTGDPGGEAGIEIAALPREVADPAAEAPAPTPGGMVLAEFQVPLGPGRLAVVALPVGVTAVEMLRLIAALPEMGSQAAGMGPTGPRPRSRLVSLDGRPL